VVPRLDDLGEVKAFLDKEVPEAKVAVAHGQMAAGQLEDVMTAFYDRRYDVLLCTTIIESGLDIPTANTMIVHRADMFGLAQLYQLRGRIGRSKARAFAYLTLAPRRQLTPNAEKRLRVLQTLDSLGAGFTLASHDLDIRGAGNLLGEEQSGHVREVGLELYQEMLEEAVTALKAGGGAGEGEEQWSPQIGIGAAVLIPESYVGDLDARLGLYQRLAAMEDPMEIEAFAAELIDRFGRLPPETENLLAIVGLKRLCRVAGIEKVDAGPKGVTLTFRAGQFANPAGLVAFINARRHEVKLRPDDNKLVYMQAWATPQDRLKGTATVIRSLADLIPEAQAA
jgi:transcription-repair coupling factor (superfamily II helicase)